MCDTGKCDYEDLMGACTMKPFDPDNCLLELWFNGDIGDNDLPEELRDIL